MKFDHSKLLGRIRECGYTQSELAQAIQRQPSTISMKLSNHACFTSLEIFKISKLLNIPISDIGDYFFCFDSSENKNNSKIGL